VRLDLRPVRNPASTTTLRQVEPDGKILVSLTNGTVLCEHMMIADGPWRRMRGLLGRQSLPLGEGMLLQPAPSIHTAFMRFPIDVVFIDGTLRVTKIVHDLRPWRIAAAHRSWGVIELARGEADRREIDVGDQLGVVQVTDKLGTFAIDSGRVAGLWSDVAHHAQPDELGDELSDSEFRRGRQEPAHTRVLVVGSDRRFRSVAAALLARRGCAVTLGDRIEEVAELIRREAPDVIILDAGVSLTAAARGAAAIEMVSPPVGLVVVGDEPEHASSAMPVLPKWGSFDGLYSAIENARPTGTEAVARWGRL
jgi:uncharacterized protein